MGKEFVVYVAGFSGVDSNVIRLFKVLNESFFDKFSHLGIQFRHVFKHGLIARLRGLLRLARK